MADTLWISYRKSKMNKGRAAVLLGCRDNGTNLWIVF